MACAAGLSALVVCGLGQAASASPAPPPDPDAGYARAARAIGVPGPDFEIEIEGRAICHHLALGRPLFGRPPQPNLRPDIKGEWAVLSVAHFCPEQTAALMAAERTVENNPAPRRGRDNAVPVDSSAPVDDLMHPDYGKYEAARRRLEGRYQEYLIQAHDPAVPAARTMCTSSPANPDC
jgi:hypothetical protein